MKEFSIFIHSYKYINENIIGTYYILDYTYQLPIAIKFYDNNFKDIKFIKHTLLKEYRWKFLYRF